MREIITKSGTVYTIENGRITREGDNSLIGEIEAEPFRFIHGSPEVGQPFAFTVKRTGESVITTKVATINDFGAYCPTHDFFDCIFCSPHADEVRDAMAGHA